MYEVTRYHDFSAGHRVVGHENKCAQLHGHNYRVHFFVKLTGLDSVGRVIDFSCLKVLCQWLEDNWDHMLILWREDPIYAVLIGAPGLGQIAFDSIAPVDFNPTAELMAEHLVRVVGPELLKPYGVSLYKVTVEETRKCAATYSQ